MLETYLGINDHKIGPPPNWRHDQYWKRRLFRKKFNYKLYIRDVENYMKKASERHWETISEYDELTMERGEKSEEMEAKLQEVLSVVTDWADRWRLPASEYDDQ